MLSVGILAGLTKLTDVPLKCTRKVRLGINIVFFQKIHIQISLTEVIFNK